MARSLWIRRAAVWLSAVLAAAVVVPVAHGDLALRFRVSVAHPGQMVVAFLGDARGNLDRVKSLGRGIHAYLVPARDRISPAHQTPTGPPTSSAWISLGPLRARHASVKMRFRLPADLAPGLYTIGFWCIPCAPPKGATFTGAYPTWRWKPGVMYQTLVRVAALRSAGDSGWKAWEIASLAVAAVTVAAGTLLYRKRHVARLSRD